MSEDESPPSCLTWGVPVLNPKPCSVGPGLGDNDPSKLPASRRVHAHQYSWYIHHQSLCPQGEPPLLPLPLQVSLAQAPIRLLLLSLVWCVWGFLYTFPEWSLYFPQSLGAPVIELGWPSKPNILGAHVSSAWWLGWGCWHWVQSSHSCGRDSVM